ncbi:hypothetical protein GCM10010345_34550 [Streptomyces canarius]|uniref:Uncharacterized protein n=1 Tax=Streptomyces canarius TaxID=285453 RepID=A0ABQ3CLJ7_9ACTN|nr:hypothetical protein GCM10010345_34550 [Streptomyces canarius]
MAAVPLLGFPHSQESGYTHMNESPAVPYRSEPSSAQTSDEKVWQSPGYRIVETALGMAAYALADCRPPPRRPARTVPTPPPERPGPPPRTRPGARRRTRRRRARVRLP